MRAASILGLHPHRCLFAVVTVAVPIILSCGQSPAVTPTPSGNSTKSLPALTQEGAVPAFPDPVEVYVMSIDGQPRPLTVLSNVPTWTWAPDDGHVALVADPDTNFASIHIISVKEGIDIASAPIDHGPYRMAWSPAGHWVAWLVWSAELGLKIEAIRADGSDRRELAAFDGGYAMYDDIFDWKDDHTLIATIWEEPNSVLFEFDLANGTKRRIGLQPAAAWAQLSRDRSKAVFIGYEDPRSCSTGHTSSLWSMSTSDGALVRILPAVCNLNSVAWSPDGSQIAYGMGGDQDNGGTYVLDVATGISRKIDTPQELYDHVVGWTSDGSTVMAFRTECRAQGSACGLPPHLVLIPVTGGSQRTMSVKGDYGDLEFALNGGALAFNNDGLQVVQLPDGAVRKVMAVDPDWQDELLGWSDDGTWFAFARSHSPGSRQFEVNADGSGLKRLADLKGPPASGLPLAEVPSPDGRKIVVSAWPLRIRDAATGKSVTVPELVGGWVTWSPDSTRFIFSTCGGDDGAPLLLVNADGSRGGNLTDGPDCSPAFSPDGQRVAFVRVGRDTQEIMMIDMNTREEKSLFRTSRGRWLGIEAPLLSLDGQMLAFCVRGVGIYVIKADGSGGQLIAAGPGLYEGLRWQSNSQLYFVSTR